MCMLSCLRASRTLDRPRALRPCLSLGFPFRESHEPNEPTAWASRGGDTGGGTSTPALCRLIPPAARRSGMSHGARPVGRTCLQLERIIGERYRSGSLGREDALNLFDELLPQARPASVYAFNQLLTAVARADSSSSERNGAALAVSFISRMARAGIHEVACDVTTSAPLASSSAA